MLWISDKCQYQFYWLKVTIINPKMGNLPSISVSCLNLKELNLDFQICKTFIISSSRANANTSLTFRFHILDTIPLDLKYTSKVDDNNSAINRRICSEFVFIYFLTKSKTYTWFCFFSLDNFIEILLHPCTHSVWFYAYSNVLRVYLKQYQSGYWETMKTHSN